MSAATHATQVALFKRLYPKGVAESLYKKSVGLADCKKDTQFGGEGGYVNVCTGGTSGGSADFATALANQGPSTQKRFFIQHKTEYQVASVSGQAIARSLNDKMAVVKVLKTETDKALYKFNIQLSGRFFGNAGGARGQISATSNVATVTITLANPSDIIGFEIGDWIQTSSDNGTGVAPAGLNGSGAQAQIVGLNRTTGTLTLGSAWSTAIPSTAASHYIYRAGDYSVSMSGLGGWVPASDPTPGESFQGMDRSIGDVVRQAGLRHAGNGGSKEDTLLDATAKAAILGSRLPRGYANPLDFNDLVKELGSKRYVDSKTREVGIGFKGVEVYTSTGTMEVVADPFVPRGTAYLVDPDDITFKTAGEAPNPLNWGGAQSTQIMANADAVQFRLGAYGEFAFEMNNVPVNVTW